MHAKIVPFNGLHSVAVPYPEQRLDVPYHRKVDATLPGSRLYALVVQCIRVSDAGLNAIHWLCCIVYLLPGLGAFNQTWQLPGQIISYPLLGEWSLTICDKRGHFYVEMQSRSDISSIDH
eukprot:scaffold50611_cov17-Tisochrysis_lutea.AAC.1